MSRFDDYDPYDLEKSINSYKWTMMIFNAFTLLIKSFFFLRIFWNLTKFVIMLKTVISDLKTFIFFHFSCIIILSAILNILRYGNCDNRDNDKCQYLAEEEQFYPGFEYR